MEGDRDKSKRSIVGSITNDVILILSRGAEKKLDLGKKILDFNDKEIILKILGK